MKIQFLNGGLANQAFQYIFARYYELSHPGEIMYLDDSYFAIHTVHNGYELEKVFGLQPHFLSECFDEDVWAYMLEEKRKGKSIPETMKENGMELTFISEAGDGFNKFNPFSGTVNKVPTNIYYPAIQEIPGIVYYHGYWLNGDWFRAYEDSFLEELTFPELVDDKNRKYLQVIESCPSAAIHIRRGDFVDLDMAIPANIYKVMVGQFREKLEASSEAEKEIGKWTGVVFSDDIEWCRNSREELGLDSFGDVIFAEGNVQGKNYIDMQLMSRCEGMIMSNSSFCYLAALLNTRKKIVVNPTGREVII
ncbi:MAG: alpha-1,2-fucosyltransferase [Lachnospiraceae bacterium]|nr:alpha-1,2-fucosyltransferase [Lachnospiraceae bacterium]